LESNATHALYLDGYERKELGAKDGWAIDYTTPLSSWILLDSVYLIIWQKNRKLIYNLFSSSDVYLY
jgi:hypothetical protein